MMGSLYRRGKTWWIGYTDANGRRIDQSTGLKVDQEALARRVLATMVAEIKTQRRQKGDAPETTTLEKYAELWSGRREKAGHTDAKHELSMLKSHALRLFGSLALEDVTVEHVREVLASMRALDLAPRTCSNQYGMLHRLFLDAIEEKLVSTSPCALGRRELPRRRDADPSWRSTAKLTRAEAQLLISHSDIPVRRRALWGLLLLSGVRIGEASALRWRAFDYERKPLSCMHVWFNFSPELKREKTTKSGVAREIPVHPTLAKLLAQWKLIYLNETGRKPEGEALVFPSATGLNLRRNVTLRELKKDFDALGMRHRRQHDLRRTFVSLSIGDGAVKSVLHWISHGGDVDGSGSDMIDVYTSLDWSALCQAVLTLKVDLLGQNVLQSVTATGDKP